MQFLKIKNAPLCKMYKLNYSIHNISSYTLNNLPNSTLSLMWKTMWNCCWPQFLHLTLKYFTLTPLWRRHFPFRVKLKTALFCSRLARVQTKFVHSEFTVNPRMVNLDHYVTKQNYHILVTYVTATILTIFDVTSKGFFRINRYFMELTIKMYASMIAKE